MDVRQIYDKFPEKKGGLKELYEKGPPNAFFLVKFWVRPTLLTQDGQLAQLSAHPPPLLGSWAGPAGLWVGGMETWEWRWGSRWPSLCNTLPFPPQADLNSTIQEGPGAFYGVSSQYSSADSMTISVSTKVCSFGKQVVEKVEVSGGLGGRVSGRHSQVSDTQSRSSPPHSADGVRPPGERPLRVPHPPLAHVRVHDQLHPQAEASA